MNFSLKQSRWCCEAVLFLFVLLFLGVYDADYLYRLQAENLFLGNSVFASETLPQSAGLLVYVSKWLLQLCYYPLLAAVVAGAGLIGIERLLSVMVETKNFSRMLLFFIPSLLILVAQSSVGYAVYENFDTSFFFSVELGTLLACVLAVGSNFLINKNKKVGFAASIVAAIVLHLVIGIFAPLSLLLVGASRWTSDRKNAIKLLGIGLVVSVLIPLIETSIYQETYLFVLLAPIPVPYFFNIFGYCLMGLLSAVAVLIVAPGFSIARLEKSHISVAVLCVLCASSFFVSFRDANCRTLFRMQRCADNNEWDDVLNAADKVKRPTRAIAAYRYCALLRKDKLAGELFNYPVRYDTLNSPFSNIDPLIFYPDLFFQSSQLNMSLFWTMEAWTNVHRSAGALKRFATIALIQGEKELALKYLEQLKQTMFYSSWAESVEHTAGIPQLFFKENPVYGEIYSSQLIDNIFNGTDDLPTTMSKFINLDPNNMERRMMLELYTKKTDNFMQDLRIVRDMYKQQMPQCMQELVCLYALNTKLDVRSLFPINPEVFTRVSNFVYQAKLYSNDHEAGAEALKEYKGMYVYYLLFSNPYPSAANLKTRK